MDHGEACCHGAGRGYRGISHRSPWLWNLIRFPMNNSRTIAALQKAVAQLTAIKDRLAAADARTGSSTAPAKKAAPKKSVAKAPAKKRAAKRQLAVRNIQTRLLVAPRTGPATLLVRSPGVGCGFFWPRQPQLLEVMPPIRCRCLELVKKRKPGRMPGFRLVRIVYQHFASSQVAMVGKRLQRML